MSAPPTSFPDASHYGTNHTDDGDESHYGKEPPDDDVSKNNPVERQSWSLKMSMKAFCVLLLFHKALVYLRVQRYNLASIIQKENEFFF